MSHSASLYRMDMPGHVCPYGLKSRDLLRRKGFDIDDKPLQTKAETEQIKELFDVDTTPQTVIDGKLIGGYDELKAYLGEADSSDSDTSYTPVITIFAMTALIAAAFLSRPSDSYTVIAFIELFVGLSMCVLAIQKLQDLENFSLQFITYDLLAQRRARYANVYAFLEAYAGLGMIAMAPAWLFAPAALFIGLVGGLSVYKAVYIDKRELKCACVGGDSKVPLGFVSLTENVMMVVMGLWMLVK